MEAGKTTEVRDFLVIMNFLLLRSPMPGGSWNRCSNENTPQVFKFLIINGSVVICAKRVISAYDLLPILFGQPFEDGLGYQTKSIAEGSIPIQEAANTPLCN